MWLIAVGWQLPIVAFEPYLKMPELWEQASAGIGRFPAVKTIVWGQLLVVPWVWASAVILGYPVAKHKRPAGCTGAK